MTDIPRILGGRYEIGELIGRGGMAQVHIGYDTRLSRTVAIKVLRSDLAADPTFLTRFRREAQSTAALNHSAIVAVYDTSEEILTSANGNTISLPYIVMEYVQGNTVSKLLEKGNPIPINEAIQITNGILSALSYSHNKGTIHRDIKPGNIMITKNGQVKVMDFGIARAITDSSATMTSTNSVVGTAQYLSPEQARGEVVDARSDLYSTGCLLYELLTGRPPFQGDSAVAVAYQHVSETPRLASEITPDISESLDRVILKSLAKKREDRYQTAAEMQSDLLKVLQGSAVNAPDTSSWEHKVTPTPPRPSAETKVQPVVNLANTQALPQEVIMNSNNEEKKKKVLIWLAVILILLAIGGIGYAALYNTVFSSTAPEVVTETVPDLTGKDQVEVRRLLEAKGLKCVIGESVENDDIEVGYFVSSNPKIGANVERGSKVTVVFSAGSKEIKVPDLTKGSYSEEKARAVLEKLNLVVKSVERVDEPGVPADTVFDINPSPNSPVAKKSAVTLYVSTGKIKLPNLIGKSLEAVKNELNVRKLSFNVEEVENDAPAGTVIKQSPLAGKIDYDARVTLYVSTGPAPEPEPEPDPEPVEKPKATKPKN